MKARDKNTKHHMPKVKGRPRDVEEVARLGRTFRGVILPSGPRGETKTVIMYVAVARSMANYGDKNILTPECVTLRELRWQIDKLKDDLDWVYKGVERTRKKQQR